MADSLQLDGNGYAFITSDANQRVIRIEFGQEFIDAVYQAAARRGLKPKCVFEALANVLNPP